MVSILQIIPRQSRPSRTPRGALIYGQFSKFGPDGLPAGGGLPKA
jgi:hypothetical protein